jgi:hypothetical protein
MNHKVSVSLGIGLVTFKKNCSIFLLRYQYIFIRKLVAWWYCYVFLTDKGDHSMKKVIVPLSMGLVAFSGLSAMSYNEMNRRDIQKVMARQTPAARRAGIKAARTIAEMNRRDIQKAMAKTPAVRPAVWKEPGEIEALTEIFREELDDSEEGIETLCEDGNWWTDKALQEYLRQGGKVSNK